MKKDVIWLYRNKIKKKVLENVKDPKTATQLSKELKIHRSSISRILIELEEKKFVRCLNPEDVSNKFYEISDKGKRLLEEYKKQI